MVEMAAGELSAVLDGYDLRQVNVTGRAALQMIYMTVRDAGWRTVPGEILAVRESDHGRLVTLDVRHRQDDLSFRWQGRVELTPNRLRFTMEGVAESAFEANRIGFCLLHPQSLRGRALRVGGPHGETTSAFPTMINPHQPFTDLDRMTYSVSATAALEIHLTGDLFEMEDHRNWSDPGWKTYCTPLSRPVPVRYLCGQRVRQSVEVTALLGGAATEAPAPDLAGRASAQRSPAPAAGSDPVQLRVGVQSSGRLPVLGLGASDSSNAGAARSLSQLLSAGRAEYLHVELEYGRDWRPRLARAIAEAQTLDLAVDVAMVASSRDLASMATAVAALGGRLHRVSVFSPERHLTEPGAVVEIRRLLSDLHSTAQFGGGSRANFAELNRGHFDCSDWDFLTYGINPQVHHTDDRSIMSTVSAISDGLAQARRIADGSPVVVGPVTLRPRFNAYTGFADPLPDREGPAPDIDPRQSADLAGVYLAGAITELIGASAITAYRTIGPRGIVSMDGAASPAGGVVAAFAGLAGWAAFPVTSTCRDVVAVAGRTTERDSVVIVTNLGESPRQLDLSDSRIVGTELLVGHSAGGRADPPEPSLDLLMPRMSVRRLVVRSGAAHG